jgi:acetolactate synthase-1/2/3 large subunit
MKPAFPSADSSAGVIARFLKARGVERVFALCGGHIMPIWMRCDAEGIRIVDVRDERAAVHMAHAHAELTGGLGVALVTAGPGVTNSITGIANAHASRAPVLILSGTVPMPQENRGGLQDMAHVKLLESITRVARTVREPALVLQELDEAVSRAFGQGGEPGPVYLDFPTDTLRAEVPKAVQLEEHFRPKKPARLLPDPSAIDTASKLLASSRKPLVVSGRGARGAGPELRRFLDSTGAVYLDTGESRGLVPDDHRSVIAAMRGKAMTEADLVITVGRRLDFQLAFGSPAVFGAAKFLRVADAPSELRDNRRGEVEVFASVKEALAALADATSSVDRAWADGLRREHVARAEKGMRAMRDAPPGSDGAMHPNRLLAAIQDKLRDDAIVVADGGDFLAFARVGLSASTYLDPGPFGCLGVGVPFGIAAGLLDPRRQVLVATGDGAFGFNAIELDTAARHGAKVVFVVANNGAWQIEVHDQAQTYGRVVGTRLRDNDHAALARALGVHGERVDKAEDLPAALDRAFVNAPALLDVRVTTDAVSSDAKSGLAWVPNLQALAAWDDAERSWRK